MLTPMKRFSIQILRKADVPQDKVAAIVGCSERTVRRVEKEKEVSSFVDMIETVEHGIGRPSKAEPFRKILKQILTDHPGLLGVELFLRLKDAGLHREKIGFL